MSESMRSFVSDGKFEVAGRGMVYSTRADQEMDRDDTGLIGLTVLIDGQPMVVKGVERTLPNHPIRIGEAIALLAVPVEAPSPIKEE